MDALAELKARALRAREFTHAIGERSITLRTPTRQEVRAALHQHRLLDHGGSLMALQLLQHQLLLAGIVGWTGVRVADVLPETPGEIAADARDPLPWSADAVALYLDARPDEADALGNELFARANVRSQAIEEDAKN
jgi:hypothetical protein